MTTSPQRRALRYFLGFLLAFIAGNAFAGSVYGFQGAEGISTHLLANTPFSDYFVPSLILLVAVGGSSVVASISVFAQHRLDRILAYVAGLVLIIWLAVQVYTIGYLSWLQPAFFGIAIVILLLATALPKPISASKS